MPHTPAEPQGFNFTVELALKNPSMRMMISDREKLAFKKPKKKATEDCIKHFMACTYQLWSHISMKEHSSIRNSAFEGFINNKRTKDVTAQTVNAIANEPLQPLGTLEQMQIKVAHEEARNEFDKLQ